MSRRIARAAGRALLGLALAAMLAGCGAASRPVPGAGASTDMSGTRTASSAPVPGVEASCTPTAPNGSAPPGQPPSKDYLGNGSLWTVLWPNGEIVFEPGGPGEVRSDGSLAMKFPFWRGEGATGTLVVTGRSLHRSGLSMTAEIPAGYGAAGLQPTALVFPEPGCWQVTASSGDASLTFITRVTRRP